ncbi:MAG: hypothetical protein EON54_15025 [Alcaligenaceae bacterium]|nr:MAG: hypothetical protein EON54_15025 [Alcaligenaceae bacterium]
MNQANACVQKLRDKDDATMNMSILGLEIDFGTAVQVTVTVAALCIFGMIICRKPAKTIAARYRRRRMLRNLPQAELLGQILIHTSKRDQRLKATTTACDAKFVTGVAVKGSSVQ